MLAILPRICQMLRFVPLSRLLSVQANDAKECVLPFEDYEECLFHTKELLRLKIVAKEMKVKEALEKALEKEEKERIKGGGKT
jgi:hypothetical protein